MIVFGGMPLFLGNSGMGNNMGQYPPQVREFDVFYEFAPMIGFHVVGSGSECQPAQVPGMYVVNNTIPECSTVLGFYVESDDEC